VVFLVSGISFSQAVNIPPFVIWAIRKSPIPSINRQGCQRKRLVLQVLKKKKTIFAILFLLKSGCHGSIVVVLAC